MPLPNVNKLKNAGGAAVVLIGVADKVWQEANRDGRAAKIVGGVKDQVVTKVTPTDPIDRISLQLDAILTAAAEAQASSPLMQDPERWRSRAATIRQKLPVVRAMEPGRRRKAVRELRKHTAALLTEIQQFGLDDPA